jgi:putative phosphoserine phosphatase / 1-acylglycerol-3-phosphate O-acyltransferase
VDVAVLEPISTDDWTRESVRDDVAAVRQQFVDTLKNWPEEPK